MLGNLTQIMIISCNIVCFSELHLPLINTEFEERCFANHHSI